MRIILIYYKRKINNILKVYNHEQINRIKYKYTIEEILQIEEYYHTKKIICNLLEVIVDKIVSDQVSQTERLKKIMKNLFKQTIEKKYANSFCMIELRR